LARCCSSLAWRRSRVRFPYGLTNRDR